MLTMQGDISSQAPTSNWKIYKDAFEPQPQEPRRATRAWDRAPVTANAPRIQGKKIWKKAGIRANKDKENLDKHIEFERLGEGARKRPRMIGAKEDIRKPSWKVHEMDENLMENPLSSPKCGAEPAVDASPVSRKRPSANHLVTPRKAAKIPLNDRSTPKEGYPRVEVPSFVPQENSVSGSAEPEIPAEWMQSRSNRRISNIGTRRKSIRVTSENTSLAELKSKRRISMGSVTEVTSAKELGNAYSFEGSAPEPSADIETPSFFASTTTELDPESFEDQEAYPFTLAEPSGTLETTASLEPMTLDDIMEDPTCLDLEPGTLAPVIPFVESTSVIDLNTLESFLVSTEDASTPVPENLQAESEVQAATQTDDLKLPANVPEAAAEKLPLAANLELAETRKENPLRHEYLLLPSPATNLQVSAPILLAEPAMQQLIPSIETPAPSPRKCSSPRKRASQTPKSKTPQKQSSRRSARITRSSSVQPEIAPAQRAEQMENLLSLLTAVEDITPTAEALTTAVASELESDEVVLEQEKTVGVETPVPALITTHNEADDQDALDQQLLGASPVKQSEEPFKPEIMATELPKASPELAVDPAALEVELAARSETDEATSPDPGNNEPSLLGPLADISPTMEDYSEINLQSEVKSDPVSEASYDLEKLEPIMAPVPDLADAIDELSEDFQETSTPDPSTTGLVEAISENAPATDYVLDETDMLRSFLTRVKANKAAKAFASPKSKRKRSLPHSPIQVPLGSTENASPDEEDEFDVSLPPPSPTKRRKITFDEMEAADEKPTRRSSRTRLPVKAAPVAAPSFIPVRRLGQDGDSTVTLRRNEEKELAALTRVNTRKNKGGAVFPTETLIKKNEEKEDPAARQRALKEIFDEKANKQKQAKKRKMVVWAEELAQFQTAEGTRAVVGEPEKEVEKPVEEKKPAKEEKKAMKAPAEKKPASKLPVEDKKAAKVGVRSKIALGMAANGTPAPKRKRGGRS